MCNKQFSQILHDLLLLIKVQYQNNGLSNRFMNAVPYVWGCAGARPVCANSYFYATIFEILDWAAKCTVLYNYIIDILVIITTKSVCKNYYLIFSTPPHIVCTWGQYY